MSKCLSRELSLLLERLRDEGGIPDGSEEPLDLILRLVEQVAAHETLVHARERELEPDTLARKLFADSEALGVRAVQSQLKGVNRKDLRRAEQALLALVQSHGAVKAQPPNHRLLLDAAILGQVGFVYSRKFHEVLSTSLLSQGLPRGGLLPDLVSRVDELFGVARPPLLWRLGPEFGTDRNVSFLLERGDTFIVRGLYRSRAERLARGVLQWKELPNGEWIGESLDEQRYLHAVRTLIVRWRDGRRFRHATLLTNLLNTTWEEVHRLHRNRSCKRAAAVHQAEAAMFWRRIAASLMILGVFAFRNMRTWASVLPAQAAIPAATVGAADSAATVSLVDSPRKAEVVALMGQTVDYLRDLTGSAKTLRGVTPSLAPFGYNVRVRGGAAVGSLAAGSVVYVDAQGAGETGKTVVVHHGSGFSTVYGNLQSIASGIRMGSAVGMGEVLGTAGTGASRLHFEARVSKRYIERGHEASVSEILTPGANLMLDPTGKLVYREARSAGGVDVGPAVQSGTFTPRSFRDTVHAHSGGAAPAAWDEGAVDLFHLASSWVPMGTIFLANAYLDDDAREMELETDDVVMAQVLDELLDLEELTDIS